MGNKQEIKDGQVWVNKSNASEFVTIRHAGSIGCSFVDQQENWGGMSISNLKQEYYLRGTLQDILRPEPEQHNKEIKVWQTWCNKYDPEDKFEVIAVHKNKVTIKRGVQGEEIYEYLMIPLLLTRCILLQDVIIKQHEETVVSLPQLQDINTLDMEALRQQIVKLEKENEELRSFFSPYND